MCLTSRRPARGFIPIWTKKSQQEADQWRRNAAQTRGFAEEKRTKKKQPFNTRSRTRDHIYKPQRIQMAAQARRQRLHLWSPLRTRDRRCLTTGKGGTRRASRSPCDGAFCQIQWPKENALGGEEGFPSRICYCRNSWDWKICQGGLRMWRRVTVWMGWGGSFLRGMRKELEANGYFNDATYTNVCWDLWKEDWLINYGRICRLLIL